MIVSGFKTSPLDASRIISGDDKPIVILLNFFTVYLSFCLAMIMVKNLFFMMNSKEFSSSLLTINYYYSSNLTSKPNPFNSCINTLKDSGNPGSGIGSPLTIASYVLALPITSSDFTVKISLNVAEAP